MLFLVPRQPPRKATKTKPQPAVGEVGELANRSQTLSLSKVVGGVPDIEFPKVRLIKQITSDSLREGQGG